jgi:carbamoyl-phosphate synthase large subunit|tara:strand:- start:11107 stop:12087 length:981 start_codon:yes stop_codon:yes gene_type:complete
MKKISIGVTCVGSVIGQGIIKSIKASSLSGVCEITGFEYLEDTVGSYWVNRTYIMPDILKTDVSDEYYMEILLDRIKKHKIQFLLIGMGFELAMMAVYRDQILKETGCTVVVSTPDTIELANDKYKTFQFLKDNRLPHPSTWLPNQKLEICYPAVIKPRIGTHSRGVSIIQNKDQLGSQIPNIQNPMIQELVGTDGKEYTCGVLFLDGEIKTQICLRRYLRDGNTSIAYHHSNTPGIIYAYLRDVTKKLRPFGPCNYQLRLDKEGIPKLFEVNARFSGSTFMRTLFGLNEVEYMIKYLLDVDLPKYKLVFGKVIRYPEDLLITATA